MLTTFDTIETIDEAESLPVWSTVWPGYSGCNSRTVYYGAGTSFTNVPASTKDWYNSQTVRIDRAPRTCKGYRGKNASPPFRYTPHYVCKTTVTEHLVRREHGSSGLLVYYQYGSVPKVGGACTPTISRVETVGPRFPRWRSVHKDFICSSYTTNGFDASEVSAAVAAVEDQVSQDALSSWDALTDLAEIGKVPAGISSISKSMSNILKSILRTYERGVFLNNDPSFSRIGSKHFPLSRIFRMRPIELLRNPYRIIRELGSLWMGYRYSIMPLVYSYRDIVKLAKRSNDVTTRAYQSISPRDLGVSLPGPSTIYKRVTYQGNITIRGCVFQSFSSKEIARFSGAGTNLIQTAWELIPMSWVADWFLNVGQYIARSCGSSYAQKHWACLSKRETSTKTTYVHLPNQDETISINKKTPSNWWGALPPTPPPVILQNPEGLYPLKTEEVDSYSRWLFDLSNARLRLDPSLNWKRYLDSAVLSLNLLTSIIRRFKQK